MVSEFRAVFGLMWGRRVYPYRSTVDSLTEGINDSLATFRRTRSGNGHEARGNLATRSHRSCAAHAANARSRGVRAPLQRGNVMKQATLAYRDEDARALSLDAVRDPLRRDVLLPLRSHRKRGFVIPALHKPKRSGHYGVRREFLRFPPFIAPSYKSIFQSE